MWKSTKEPIEYHLHFLEQNKPVSDINTAIQKKYAQNLLVSSVLIPIAYAMYMNKKAIRLNTKAITSIASNGPIGIFHLFL